MHDYFACRRVLGGSSVWQENASSPFAEILKNRIADLLNDLTLRVQLPSYNKVSTPKI